LKWPFLESKLSIVVILHFTQKLKQRNCYFSFMQTLHTSRIHPVRSACIMGLLRHYLALAARTAGEPFPDLPLWPTLGKPLTPLRGMC
jgi:hypothetical protein